MKTLFSTNSIRYLEADCWLTPRFLERLIDETWIGCLVPPCKARNFKAESKLGFSRHPPLSDLVVVISDHQTCFPLLF